MADVHLIQPYQIDDAAYVGRPVTTDGLDELPLGSVVADPDGHVLLAYLPHETAHPAHLAEDLRRVKFTESTRTNGLKVRSQNFGYLPRNTVRRPWCSSSILSREHPRLAGLLTLEAGRLEQTYESIAPGVFDEHAHKASRVLPAWRLPGARCFTGGIVNRDAAIGWHHDAGNFKQSFSAMICTRRFMAGGHFAVPALGLWLGIADSSVVYFDGQSLLHGVTPMEKLRVDAYRFTVVYFSMTQLWSCLAPDAEQRHAQETTQARGRKRAAGVVDPAVTERVNRGA